MEDEEFVDSCMGGKPRKAGKFASSLRLSLWSEHLGLHPREVGALFILEGTTLLNFLLTICAFLKPHPRFPDWPNKGPNY